DLEASYQKDTLKALTYYHKSYEYAVKNEDVWQQGKSLDFIVYYQLALKQKEAKANIDKLYQLAKENDQKDTEASALDYYSQWYSRLGDYKKAYEYQKRYHAVSDSLQSDNIKEKAAMLDVRFRVANKEQEIGQLKATQKIQQLTIRQKNTINYILIGSTIAFLIISLLLYRNYKNRQKLQQAKIDELETEKQLTATEAVLKGEEQERTRLAKDLHDGLGGMLSGIKFSLGNIKENLIMTPDNAHAFERSIDMLDSSIQEMRRVAHNMMPEILVKYGLDTALKEFCAEMDRGAVLHVNYQSVGMHQADIPQTTSVTIYRIIQELLNNTIKHANAKNVLVQLHQSRQEKLLAITVEDDGNGFDMNLLKHAGGMGWSNIQNRVEFLKGKIDLQSAPGKGTSVMIEINI
ncbi:sensor histidine kinase, partial [Pedobacter sp.]|uniref:sensor histidine kinase n=1 Tax=Pedobacter sp. TaxID=1411316 RepID=UPI002C63EC3A